ncbi:PQQ-binding-like beta-propeller repeat protein [Mycolicibacterium sediminis]|uniref:Uncharacterized protein n=1 Tax=Mycolicibacterium sediminis TaxID=1286180 RepID=A0A7I7QQW1_9MYCO|nr:PQQ-binding-like beta-propeller repeat protein [Mycolicibacterium sediminis]BBY28704.1 hypothetical protein MSEDJ_28000 [Mycolicibacterium sediminis]
MIQPERRTRGDVMVAVAIAVTIAVTAALIWWTSDARATISRPAATPVPTLKAATAVPDTLRQLWAAGSPATRRPVLAGGSVVTGDGTVVDGRDPVTGNVLWSYSRDVELCGVTSVYQNAVAVYPDARGCGQVTTIDGKTGRRDATRSAYADPAVRLSGDGATVLSVGENRLELWRSDMIRMISYGRLDARIKPGVPAQPLCRFTSAASSTAMVAVMEACPDEPDLRLTLLKPSDEEDQPETKFVDLPGVAATSDARVIAVSDTTVAVYLPTPKPTVNVVDDTGTTISSTPLTTGPAPDATASASGDLVTWWTGDGVMVFDANELRYRFTVNAAEGKSPVGPGVVMAGKLLVPVTGGYDVFDTRTGVGDRHIALSRSPGQVPVVPAVAGSTVIEQRGDSLVALGP